VLASLSMLGEMPPPPDPFKLTGEIIDRKYRVDRLVAEGGFGVVYAGWHLGLESPIAIKVLKRTPGIAAEDWTDRLLQFLDEAKTLAKLRHPHIVTVLDAGTMDFGGADGGLPWMVLEWLEGTTLREDLESRRRMSGRSPAECLALLRPVLEAIGDAHAAGIVHRDLKPSNIMLTPRWGGMTARVLDFGIAKMLVGTERERGNASGNTATGTRVSSFTLHSAAPEQLSGSRTGPWTDVYALALMLTEMLADRPPHPPHDPHEHYQWVFHAERPTPRTLGVEVGTWERVLTRALAVRPSERHASARELLADLERELPGTGRGAAAGDTTASALAQSRTEPPAAPASSLRDRARAGWLGWAIAGAMLVVTFAWRRADSPVPLDVASPPDVTPLVDAGMQAIVDVDASLARALPPAPPSATGAAVPRRRTLHAPIASVSSVTPLAQAPPTEARVAPAASSAPSRDAPGIIERSPY
jgi:serine/threonine protein kinase